MKNTIEKIIEKNPGKKFEKKVEETEKKDENIKTKSREKYRRTQSYFLNKTQEELDVEDRIKRGFYGEKTKTGNYKLKIEKNIAEKDRILLKLEKEFDKKFKKKYMDGLPYMPQKNILKYYADKRKWINERLI